MPVYFKKNIIVSDDCYLKLGISCFSPDFISGNNTFISTSDFRNSREEIKKSDSRIVIVFSGGDRFEFLSLLLYMYDIIWSKNVVVYLPNWPNLICDGLEKASNWNVLPQQLSLDKIKNILYKPNRLPKAYKKRKCQLSYYGSHALSLFLAHGGNTIAVSLNLNIPRAKVYTLKAVTLHKLGIESLREVNNCAESPRQIIK